MMRKQKTQERCHLCGNLFRDGMRSSHGMGGICVVVCDRTLCNREMEELGRAISSISLHYMEIRRKHGLFDHTIPEIQRDREETEKIIHEVKSHKEKHKKRRGREERSMVL